VRHDELAKNTLVPLILRVTLAVIFLFHGLTKIVSPQNHQELGRKVWRQPTKVPADVLAR
jgi:uncharacterized membrane protein YphA (DoxX/SURF4 family)